MKSKIKSLSKKWWIWVIIVVLFFVGVASCSSDNKTVESEKPIINQTENNTPIEDNKENNNLKQEKDPQILINTLGDIIKTSHSATAYNFDFYEKDKVIYFDIYIKDLNNTVSSIIIYNMKEEWAAVKTGLEFASQKGSELANTMGYKDYIVNYRYMDKVDDKNICFLAANSGYINFDMVDTLTK